jgi:hypothetical protein
MDAPIVSRMVRAWSCLNSVLLGPGSRMIHTVKVLPDSHPKPATQSPVAASGRAWKNTSSPWLYPTGIRNRMRHAWWSRLSLLIQLGREIRNLHYRILTAPRARQFERGVDLGALAHKLPNRSYLDCDETRARTEDTLRLTTENLHLTCLGTDLFVKGWNMGARCRTGCNSCIAQHKNSQPSPTF